MKPTYQLLASFIVGLVILIPLLTAEMISPVLGSRILILVTILPALTLLIRKQLKTLPILATPSKSLLTAKFISIALFLVLLLLYSHLMAELGVKPFASFVFEYLVLLPLLLLLLPRYLSFCSKRQAEPEDEYARFGYCLLNKQKFISAEHQALILKSLVKLFFIPIMVGALLEVTEFLLLFNWSFKPLVLISGLFFFGLAFDLIIASIGYVFASKLLGNDVKSTDATLGGWFICLLCYPPLLIVYQWFAKQTDTLLWYHWLSAEQPLYWFWAAMVTLSWILYWWSSAQFGWHFSNLTWRKLVDYGPYKYTKHPAYIAKNIYWWMHTVPFFGVASQQDLLRNIAGMVFVSTVYYLRAKTEERHLLKFTEYQNYAAYIAQHGIFSRVTLKLKKPSH